MCSMQPENHNYTRILWNWSKYVGICFCYTGAHYFIARKRISEKLIRGTVRRTLPIIDNSQENWESPNLIHLLFWKHYNSLHLTVLYIFQLSGSGKDFTLNYFLETILFHEHFRFFYAHQKIFQPPMMFSILISIP